MIKTAKKFLLLLVMTFTMSVMFAPISASATSLITGDIGDYGVWTTENNREQVLDAVKYDVQEFYSNYNREYIDTGVPVEAKLGISFIHGLTNITHILNESLVHFVEIFLVVAFVFWIMFESYKLITDGKSKVMPVAENFVKKGITLGIWLIILGIGLPKLFGDIMGPIMAFGSYISNMILDTVADVGGFKLSDTCSAIHAYASAQLTDTSIMTADTAANIMCVPTRMSQFYYGAISFGWNMFLNGFGISTFAVLLGIVLVFLFTYSAFKFAFVAFGVIADLFLVIILLPFTAITETIQKTSYKGIAGDIYNGFLGLFKTSSLSSQVKKFVDAALYFISLSIVVAIGGALISGVMSFDPATNTMNIINDDAITLLLTGVLVAYIATHSDEIAKLIGGGIDSAMGSELAKDVKKTYNDKKKQFVEFIKALKK